MPVWCPKRRWPKYLPLFFRLEYDLEREKRERDARERELRERELRELEFREKMKREMELKPPGR